jgi:hypothetical protein
MTLIAHCGTRKISREELREIATPAATTTHQPVPHSQIVEALLETLSFRHLMVVRDEYAVSADGMRMFGIIDLEREFSGVRFSIGLRNANDKSMRLALTVGYRVLICDNMAFMGDFTPVMHKHTCRLDLIDVISIGVDKIQRNFEPLKNQIAVWQERRLEDTAVKLLLYEAFVEGKLQAPKSLLPAVHRQYFNPDHEQFQARTFWSLSNAFTGAFKKLTPVRQFQATAKLGDFLARYSLLNVEENVQREDALAHTAGLN